VVVSVWWSPAKVLIAFQMLRLPGLHSVLLAKRRANEELLTAAACAHAFLAEGARAACQALTARCAIVEDVLFYAALSRPAGTSQQLC
jgi:hypothetical protein